MAIQKFALPSAAKLLARLDAAAKVRKSRNSLLFPSRCWTSSPASPLSLVAADTRSGAFICGGGSSHKDSLCRYFFDALPRPPILAITCDCSLSLKPVADPRADPGDIYSKRHKLGSGALWCMADVTNSNVLASTAAIAGKMRSSPRLSLLCARRYGPAWANIQSGWELSVL